MDIVDPEKRSKMMSNIRSKNTKPEILIRKKLFARGYRYSLHPKQLQGKPDIVLKKYNAVIFVHGCFWHMHNCELFVLPKSRVDFWTEKLTDNKERDEKNRRKLLEHGWRIGIIWECSVKRKKEEDIEIVIDKIDKWIKNQNQIEIEIP